MKILWQLISFFTFGSVGKEANATEIRHILLEALGKQITIFDSR
jgi:hypothetical protein